MQNISNDDNEMNSAPEVSAPGSLSDVKGEPEKEYAPSTDEIVTQGGLELQGEDHQGEDHQGPSSPASSSPTGSLPASSSLTAIAHPGASHSNTSAPPAVIAGTATPQFDWLTAKTYNYTDEQGHILYQIAYWDDGSERVTHCRRRDEKGEWTQDFEGMRRVLFDLYRIGDASTVFFVENEEIAEYFNSRLPWGYPIIATTAAGQPLRSSIENLTPSLRDKTIAILLGNDKTRVTYANRLYRCCRKDGFTVTVIDLFKVLPERDIVEYFNQGAKLDDLLDIIGDTTANQWPEVSNPLLEPDAYRLLGWEDIHQASETKWLVRNLLAYNNLSLLTGKHASLKSFLAMDIALCVATGTQFHGFDVQKANVLYVAAEGSAGLKKRTEAWFTHHRITKRPEGMKFLDRPLPLADAQTLEDISVSIKELRPSLIVLDTLARCAVDLDENSSRDMGLFINSVSQLARAFDAHIMTVHHNNKEGTYRGSSAWPAAVDTHLSLERKADVVKLTIQKQKDVGEVSPINFEPQSVYFPDPGGTSEELDSLVLERTDSAPDQQGCDFSPIERKSLNQLLETGASEGLTASEWEKACKNAQLQDSNPRRTRRKLVALGAVIRKDKNSNTISEEQYADLNVLDKSKVLHYPNHNSLWLTNNSGKLPGIVLPPTSTKETLAPSVSNVEEQENIEE